MSRRPNVRAMVKRQRVAARAAAAAAADGMVGPLTPGLADSSSGATQQLAIATPAALDASTVRGSVLPVHANGVAAAAAASRSPVASSAVAAASKRHVPTALLSTRRTHAEHPAESVVLDTVHVLEHVMQQTNPQQLSDA